MKLISIAIVLLLSYILAPLSILTVQAKEPFEDTFFITVEQSNLYNTDILEAIENEEESNEKVPAEIDFEECYNRIMEQHAQIAENKLAAFPPPDELIVPMPRAVLTEREVAILASLVWLEFGTSEYGMQLIAEVVLNRLEDDRFPNNISDIIFQASQFSVADQVMYTVAPEAAYEAIDRALDETEIPEALFFAQSRIRAKNIAQNLSAVMVWENVTFYAQ